MSRRNKILVVIAVICLFCGFALIFSYFYLNNKMKSEILNIAENSIVVNNTEVNEDIGYTYEPTTEEEFDNSYSMYLDALDSEFADIGADQKVKKVKDYKSVLEIPQYDILAHIYDDVSRDSLNYGVGHYPQTVGLGEKGNCAIAGHSSLIYDCILNEVKNMKIMDSFNIYDKQGKKHIYYVQTMFVVEPESMYVLDTTDASKSEVTIITCTNGGKQRLIIKAIELTKEELEEYTKQLKEEKLNLIDSIIEEENNKVGSLNYWYDYNYVQDKGFKLDKYFSSGSIIRYLLRGNTLSNKHNIYSYKLNNDILKEFEVK